MKSEVALKILSKDFNTQSIANSCKVSYGLIQKLGTEFHVPLRRKGKAEPISISVHFEELRVLKKLIYERKMNGPRKMAQMCYIERNTKMNPFVELSLMWKRAA